MRWLAIAVALATSLAAGCGGDPSPDTRRDRLERSYRAGVEQARQDIAAGRAVLYVDERRAGGTLRIDRETGLPLRVDIVPCGTGVDTEAAGMGVAGYRAEIARALAAGELGPTPLTAKVPDEAALRARFELTNLAVELRGAMAAEWLVTGPLTAGHLVGVLSAPLIAIASDIDTGAIPAGRLLAWDFLRGLSRSVPLWKWWPVFREFRHHVLPHVKPGAA